MKAVCLAVMMMYSFLAVVAQKTIAAFGKIDKADLLMKDCSFDKGADAIKLIDWGNTYYTRGTQAGSVFKTVFEQRTRIKIFNNKGTAHADVKIPYYSNNGDEKIIRLTAYSYNLDAAGNIVTTAVKKSSIFNKKINNSYAEMIIAFPDVRPGTVIEYKYVMERETMGQLRDWYFQERIPVQYSEYQITIPQIFRFIVKPSVIDVLEEKRTVVEEVLSGNNGLVKTKSLQTNYIMRNLPAIKDEPFMGAPKDYMQRLEFQLTQVDRGHNDIQDLRLKWSDVITDLGEDESFGKQLQKEVTGAAGFIAQAGTIADTLKRLQFIYDHFKKTFHYEGENSLYTYKGIVKTWEAKTGNGTDINLLLVKILSDAGLKAAPILFSTRDNGLVNTFYPIIKQFNAVMAYVAIGKKYFILDATDETGNCNLLPESVIGTKGFIVDGEEGVWKDITENNFKYRVSTAIDAQIDTAGVMKGNCYITSYDYARKERSHYLLQPAQNIKASYITGPGPAVKIEKIALNNIEADSLPLEQDIRFSNALNSSGNYLYFSMNLFSGFDKNPFTAEERIADIDFTYCREYTLFGNYTLPQNYMFAEVPQDMYMIMPDTSIIFIRSVRAEENLLNVKVSLEFKKPVYAAEDYPLFKEFYKKLFDKLNEQVVIKKKELL
jgi:Domain of Unknown Function with PDB structure (DUF3857)